jgi:monothiol glutaredoxin
MALTPEQTKQIESLIASDKVVLFMKGNRQQPQCGFSATVVGILDELLPSYTTVNVLADPAIREGIKQFSSWPTIPQLYVEGEFIGGCDIVKELYASGEIFGALKLQIPTSSAPKVTITPAALDAFKSALENAAEGDLLRLKINASFGNDLSFDSKNPGDVEIHESGVLILMDPMSASRANGIVIDFTQNNMGAGFQVNNPNAPAAIKQMSVQELKQKFDAGDKFLLLDVRTQDEWNTAHIEGAKLMQRMPQSEIDGLDKDMPIVFHCHGGGRSQRMAEQFKAKGFKNLANLAGGIRAWSKEIDPSVPNY